MLCGDGTGKVTTGMPPLVVRTVSILAKGYGALSTKSTFVGREASDGKHFTFLPLSLDRLVHNSVGVVPIKGVLTN